MRALLLAGLVLAVSTAANATMYNAYSRLSYQQLSFTEPPDATPGYYDADTKISVTNTGTAAQTLFYVALGLSLNGTNAPWSSTPTYIPRSRIVGAVYAPPRHDPGL